MVCRNARDFRMKRERPSLGRTGVLVSEFNSEEVC